MLLYAHGGQFWAVIARAAVAVIDATRALNTRAGAGAVVGEPLCVEPRQAFPVGIMSP